MSKNKNGFGDIAAHEATALLASTAVAMRDDGHGHIGVYDDRENGIIFILCRGHQFDDNGNVVTAKPALAAVVAGDG